MLATSVGGLCLLGLPIVLSASAPAAILAGELALVLRRPPVHLHGPGCDAAARREPHRLRVVRRLRFPLLGAGLLLLIVVFVPGLGHFAGGSSRWIGIGPFQLQPSELMKLAIVVFAADVLARRAKRRDQWQAFVRPLFLFMAIAAVLIVKQPDLGTAIVIGCITFSMLFAAGTRLRLLVLPGATVLAAGAVVALKATYSARPPAVVRQPVRPCGSTSGYQVVQSLATLGLGGMTGSGVGASVTPWGFLPNAHTDFVFAVIAGNLGLVGAFVVLAGFGAFGWAGFRIAAAGAGPVRRATWRSGSPVGYWRRR